MLKKILFFIICGIVIYSGVSYAAPCYGTHMPKQKQWIWGLQGDFLIDRNLDNNQGSTSGNRYFLTGTLGIFDWICFDGKIGVGDVSWRNSNPGNVNFNNGFAGAYGFRIKGYENKDMGIKTVVGFQHISAHPSIASPTNDEHRVIIDDWQGSALISKDISNFVPYLGVRYGTVDYIKWVNEHDRRRIKSEKVFGAVIGADYLIQKDIRLNIEGDFIDGEELSIGISRDF
ncbi:MAG: hypothetical protein Q8O12_03960 [Candidatus Omnitrophota bacterium]|nr:hypothetical protein [Candidatus Omnitrophota bacterium]